MAAPAYRRLDVDERRRRLVELGEDLFTRYSYDEISMADIAREAGISKALLYHYFRGKQDFFQVTLAEALEELRLRTEPDPSLPPLEGLRQSLDAYLTWIEEHASAYRKLMRGASAAADVRNLLDGLREVTARRILEGLYPETEPPAGARAAVRGWLWFIDGACLDRLDHDDIEREELLGLILGTLVGALVAAGEPPASLG